MTELLELSVVILAQRDDDNLHAAVESSLFAKEVVVVWTSPAAAPNFLQFPQVMIRVLPPVTDFAEARNHALQLTTLPWVFFLDSDEVIAAEAWPELKKILQNQALSGASVRRIDYFLGRQLNWGEVGNVHILRFFRRDAGHFVRPVHEVAEVKGKVIQSGVVIRHTPHSSISRFWQKISGYAKQESELRQQNNEHFNVVKLLVFPSGKFLQNYVLRLGFLDGWRGLIYAVLMSVHSAAVRALQYEHQQKYEKK